MTNIYTGKIFIKIATHVLLVGLQEVPILGSVIRIAGGSWQILRDAQAQATQEDRITQLEQAAVVTPEDARLLARKVITAEQQSGKVINPDLAAAVTDLISVMPAQIRERTHATLSHARCLSIKPATVLPVTAVFKEVEQEAFYSGLFPQRRPQFQPGAPLPNYNDEWVLERLIGAGGFGEVWLAKHKRMRSRPPMAVKFCQDANSAKMLRDEADKLDALCEKLPIGTPHVVALLDFQFNVTPYWLAMEYVDGGTLESRMRLGPMDWPAAWKLFAPLLDGMERIHKLNIVHRDLKPSNILLPGGNNPRIADFGIGKILAEQNAATRRAFRSFTVRGTGSLGYMSPEQKEGILDAHPSDDVYALGVILWQMLTGRLEPLRFPAHVQKLAVPDVVKNAIIHCVFMPREERLADAGVLLNQLAESHPKLNEVFIPKVDTSAPPIQPAVPPPSIIDPQALISTVRDPFETKAEFATRLLEIIKQFNTAATTGDLRYQAGTARLNKDSYDIDTQIFLLDITWTPWAAEFDLFTLGYLVIPRDQAKILWQQGVELPIFLLFNSAKAKLNVHKVVLWGLQRQWDISASDYVMYADGTVLDNETGLMWQRCAQGQTWDGTTCVGNPATMTWDDAMPKGKQKTWPAFAGYTDWRLPTIDELQTLMVEGSSPTIDQTVFPNTLGYYWFWSASSNAYGSSSAWDSEFFLFSFCPKAKDHRMRQTTCGASIDSRTMRFASSAYPMALSYITPLPKLRLQFRFSFKCLEINIFSS